MNIKNEKRVNRFHFDNANQTHTVEFRTVEKG